MHSYKKITVVVLLFICYCGYAQNVGVGTTTPNSSAILDVSSTSKGLLLPRVADTSNVNTPAEGLVVYSRAAKAPNYFDGSKWNNVADARNNFVPVDGFIKYSLPGSTAAGGIAPDAGPLDAIDYNNNFRTPFAIGGGGGTGRVRGMDSIIMLKEFDANSVYFKRVQLGGTVIPTIEIQHFAPGASTPFYSVKLSNVRVIDQTFLISNETGKLTEQYSLVPTVVGYKDWITGKSFSYNVAASTFGSY